MPHKITLTQEHQAIVIAALLRSLDNKLATVIKDDAKKPHTIAMYEDAGTKLMSPVHCTKKSNNLFTWVIDQLEHSPRVLHTETVQRAILICRYAASNDYDEFTRELDNFLFD